MVLKSKMHGLLGAAKKGIHPRTAAIAAAGLAVLLSIVAACLSAVAGAYQFGPETEFRRLQSTSMKSIEGAPIDLAHRVTLHWFFLPYSVTSDGYALVVQGQKGGSAIDAAQVAELQKDGALPRELRSIALSLEDHVIGRLLWITGAPLALWLALGNLFPMRRQVPHPAAALPVRPAPRRAIGEPKSALPATPIPRLSPKSLPVAAAKRPAPVQQAATRAMPSTPAAGAAPHSSERRTLAPAVPRPSAATPAALPPSERVRLLPVARVKCRVKSLKVAA